MICNPSPPFWPNGTWSGWSCALANVTNSTDPISGTVGVSFSVLPIIPTIFLFGLYVFLWIQFAKSPSRFKVVSITALVLVISIVFGLSAGYGWGVLNFFLFSIAFFVAYLFKR